ncbi:MAG: TonB-dependent receptor [Tannerella sp.]|nr:TonB-dependent receptor [Tannerella sp.]
MKTTILFLIIGVSVSYAGNSYSQETYLSVNLTNKRVKDIFREIEKRSEYIFFYYDDVLDVNRKVSIRMNNQTIDKILDHLFEGTNSAYAISDRQIFITRKDNPQVFDAEMTVLQQSRRITGTVVDQFGGPVIGANVVEKGTTNGTVTDLEGNFTLTVRDHAVLSFSYIGYITQEVSVTSAGGGPLTVKLLEDTQAVEEVVVIGYGTAKKSDLVGAVSSISSKKFSAEPVLRLDNILQGRVPGVQVTATSGAIDAGAKVRIRGTTSLNKGNDPLYVVDGIIGAGSYNMSDVESIEVLKDASSTAIYGSRGANGVVLITTKKGKEGRARVTFETNQGTSRLAKRYDVLSPYEYALALNDIKGSGTISEGDLELYRTGKLGIDWQDQITQVGHTQDYFLTVSGGNRSVRYLISGEILDQTGITVFSKYKRYMLRNNIDADVTKWFRLTSDIRLYRSNASKTSADFGRVTIYSPTIRMKNPETGRYNLDPYNSIDGNPYADLAAAESEYYGNHVNGNLTALFSIVDGLTLSVQGGVNYSHNPNYGFSSAMRSPTAQSSMSNTSNQSLSWQNTNNLTYSKKFGDHSITATAVWELTAGQSSGMNISGSNLLTETVGYWNIGLASTKSESNSYSESSMSSALGRVQYNYKGKYMASASFRADGSSHFQGNNKWGYFPTAGLGWNIAEEDFMHDQTFFRKLKLRANAGIIGNQGIGSYETLGMLTRENHYYGTTTQYPGFWASAVPTPGIHWEKTSQYDVGLEFSLFDQRLNVDVDWFLKDTKDLLNRKNIPNYNGGGTFWVNQGHVRNTGMDLMIDAIPVETKDFSWETTLTGSLVKNEVIDLAGEEQIVSEQLSGVVSGCMILKPGHPIGSFYVFDWVGIDEATGVNLFRKTDGSITPDPSSDDRIVTGQSEPACSFGWNNTFRWRDFELNTFFNSALGYQRLDVTRYQMTAIVGPSMFINLRDAYYKNWDMVANKADAEYASMKNGNNKLYGNSTQYLEEGSFLKLKNVSIAYHVPRKWLKAVDVRVSLSAQNLFTVTKYKGYDPEVITNYTASVIGADWGAYPIPRTYTLGVKVDF